MTLRRHNGQAVMDFYPHTSEPSIYWLNATIVKDQKVLESLALSLSIGYDLWHKCLGHPSSDILHQFSQDTLGLPKEVPIPSSVLICKGCAQGKMMSSSFPDSERRSSKTFGLIHSDLKQLLVLSHHKYQYICTFYDDYSSFG